MTVFLLVRHATNDYVKEGRLAGRTPGVHLNAQGQREAQDLARRTAHLPIEAIYSSPLERALDTADALAECHKLPVQIIAGLVESDAGEWTGKKITELNTTDTWKAIQTSPIGVKLPGGESIDEVQTRMVAVIEAARQKHPDGLVAIVSHADPLKSVIAHYLNLDLNQFQRIAISPASVTVLQVDDKGGAVLLRTNDTGPLPKWEKPRPVKQEQSQAQAGKTENEHEDGHKMAEANIVHDLNPVSRVTVGALGEPGQRTFFLQGRQDTTMVTLVAEKEQMNSLAQGVTELLSRLGDKTDAPAGISAYELALEQPVEPLFRIGQLGLGYDQENDLIVIVAYAQPENEEQETVDVVRFWASRDQMRALARQVAEVAAAGRPTCVLCGRPIDPEGHFCPRRNGHATYVQMI
jgi:probable phosphoglycerate mutase